MFKKIYEEIVKHQKIVIIRHQAPDYDAYGSQAGLCLSLRNHFPNKEILMDGDEPTNYTFPRKMDKVSEEFYYDSLVIVVDTSAKNMISNDYHKHASKVVVLDHHDNDPDLGDIVIMKNKYSSASELVTEFLDNVKIKIDAEAANALYTGMVSDSNRFLYSGTTEHTFKMAEILLKSGADISGCYKRLERTYKLNEKKMMGYIMSNIQIDGKVAYVFVKRDIRQSLNLETYFVTRGCVNLLSSIENTEAFMLLAEADEDSIYLEFRSKEKPVIEVAKKYNGGGHDLACGAKVDINYNIKEIIDSVNEVLR